MDKIRLSLFLCTLGVVSATQVACSSSLNKQLSWAVAEGDCAQVDKFLRAGANVNAVDMYGNTALHLAARYGHEQVVERLLQEGANVNSATGLGRTALHWAALYGYESVVDWLLRAGADVNAVDMYGDTALYLAKNCAIAQRLVQAGADLEVLNNRQKSPLVRCINSSPWEEERNVAKWMGYLISIGAGIDDLLQSDDLREHLRPHVDLIKSRAAFLRDLLNEKQGVYSDLQGLIGQHAGFPISKQAVDKMEAILLRDLIENFVGLGYRMPEEVVGKMEACLQ